MAEFFIIKILFIFSDGQTLQQNWIKGHTTHYYTWNLQTLHISTNINIYFHLSKWEKWAVSKLGSLGKSDQYDFNKKRSADNMPRGQGQTLAKHP